MPDEDRGDALLVPTRIAVYDDLLAAPRIVDIEPSDIASYIEHIAAKTYELAQAQGSSIPYTVIREVCENFIHAKFMEPCVSIQHGDWKIKAKTCSGESGNPQRSSCPIF